MKKNFLNLIFISLTQIGTHWQYYGPYIGQVLFSSTLIDSLCITRSYGDKRNRITVELPSAPTHPNSGRRATVGNGSASDSYTNYMVYHKGPGFDSYAAVKKPAFTVVSVVWNPLETV